MKKEFILHIGFSKNASTYLQKYVFPSFDSEKCYYIGKFTDEFDSINEIINIVKNREPFEYSLDELKDRLAKILEDKPHEKIIFSDETLVGSMFDNYKGGQQLASQLYNLFGNVKFIVVFRRQDRLVESMYRMMVRTGYFHSIEKYLRYYKGGFNTPDAQDYYIRNRLQSSSYLDLHILDYSARIKYYQDLLGFKNVQALPLEMLEKETNLFMNRLCHFMNVPMMKALNEKPFNTSYPISVVKLSTVLNRFSIMDTNGLGFLPLRRNRRKKDPSQKTLIDKIVSRLDMEYFYLFL